MTTDSGERSGARGENAFTERSSCPQVPATAFCRWTKLTLPNAPRSNRTPPPATRTAHPMDRPRPESDPRRTTHTTRPVEQNVDTLPCVNAQAGVAGGVSCLTLAHARAYLCRPERPLHPYYVVATVLPQRTSCHQMAFFFFLSLTAQSTCSHFQLPPFDCAWYASLNLHHVSLVPIFCLPCGRHLRQHVGPIKRSFDVLYLNPVAPLLNVLYPC